MIVNYIQNIEQEIEFLTQKRNKIFNEWVKISKTKAPDMDWEDEDDQKNQAIYSLMEEQRRLSQQIMSLYQKIDED
jgi:hypothetical protein